MEQVSIDVQQALWKDDCGWWICFFIYLMTDIRRVSEGRTSSSIQGDMSGERWIVLNTDDVVHVLSFWAGAQYLFSSCFFWTCFFFSLFHIHLRIELCWVASDWLHFVLSFLYYSYTHSRHLSAKAILHNHPAHYARVTHDDHWLSRIYHHQAKHHHQSYPRLLLLPHLTISILTVLMLHPKHVNEVNIS